MDEKSLTVLEDQRAYLFKGLAMMRTGTMSVRVEGRDATPDAIRDYQRLADELDRLILSSKVRNAQGS